MNGYIQGTIRPGITRISTMIESNLEGLHNDTLKKQEEVTENIAAT